MFPPGPRMPSHITVAIVDPGAALSSTRFAGRPWGGQMPQSFWYGMGGLLAAGGVILGGWFNSERTGTLEHAATQHFADSPAVAASLLPQVRIALTEPQKALDVSYDRARQINAAIPMIADELVPAHPFVFDGSASDREEAAICLAAAAFYEAGDNHVGQQAVAQVVLNRTRHQLFPKSICGVVFQGSGRKTGCQFTFTCDGSLARRTPDVAEWKRARAVADDALSGAVFPPVGLATHYHTNWVVPYWSGSMDKIAQVGTHLFYRWRGSIGSAGAFAAAVRGPETIDPRLLALRAVDPTAAASPSVPSIVPLALPLTTPNTAYSQVELTDQQGENRLLRFDATARQERIAATALKLCQGAIKCQVYGYVDKAPDKAWAVVARTDFYYDGGSSGSKLAYWNCRKFSREVAAECLPGTAVRSVSAMTGSEQGS